MHDPTVYRILDVNIDRAREALRVIEDYARFACDDRAAAAAVKAARHDVQQLATLLGPDALLAARDITTDVGKTVKTAGELTRGDVAAVVRAAFGRLQEATRSLSEYAKLVSATAAAAAETLRYQTYELEQRVVLRSTRRAAFAAVRVYVLLTAELCRGDWQEVATAALHGGAGCLQLREKTLDDGELLRRATALRALTWAHDALLMINDRPDIARLCEADGVHVGQDDLSVADVRRIAGPRLLVGKSTHTPAQFAAALAEAPDYLAVGPMFASATKPQDQVAGPETLRAVRWQSELPLTAIGGITPASASTVFAAGADSVAICSAIIAADDVEAATRAFVTAAERAN